MQTDVWSEHQGLANCTKLQLLIYFGCSQFFVLPPVCNEWRRNRDGRDGHRTAGRGWLHDLFKSISTCWTNRQMTCCLSFKVPKSTYSCWQQWLSKFLNTGKCNEWCGRGPPKPLFLCQWKLDAYWGGWNWVSGVENLMMNGSIMNIFMYPYASVMEGLVCKISQYPLYTWKAR